MKDLDLDAWSIQNIKLVQITGVVVFQMDATSALRKLSVSLRPLARGFQVQQHALFAALVLQIKVDGHDLHRHHCRAVNIMGLRRVQILQRRLAAFPASLRDQFTIPFHGVLCLAVGHQNIKRTLCLFQRHRKRFLLLLQHRVFQQLAIETYEPTANLLAVDACPWFEVVEVHFQLISEDVSLQRLFDGHLLTPVEIDLIGPVQRYAIRIAEIGLHVEHEVEKRIGLGDHLLWPVVLVIVLS